MTGRRQHWDRPSRLLQGIDHQLQEVDARATDPAIARRCEHVLSAFERPAESRLTLPESLGAGLPFSVCARERVGLTTLNRYPDAIEGCDDLPPRNQLHARQAAEPRLGSLQLACQHGDVARVQD